MNEAGLKAKGNFFNTMNNIRAAWTLPKEILTSIPNYVFRAKPKESTTDLMQQSSDFTEKRPYRTVKNQRKPIPDRSVSTDQLRDNKEGKPKARERTQIFSMQLIDDSNESFSSQHEAVMKVPVDKPSQFARSKNAPDPSAPDSSNIFKSESKKKAKKMINSSYFKKKE